MSKGKKTDEEVDKAVVVEFGGPIGVTLMMIGFPLWMVYMCGCVITDEGNFIMPTPQVLWHHVTVTCWPDAYAFKMYIIFVLVEIFFALVMPGINVQGFRVPSEGNIRLNYNINGIWSFRATIILVAVLHVSGIWRITELIDHYGPLMGAAIICGYAVSIATYVLTLLFGRPHRMSGNHFYDLFMGAPLNPRLFGGRLDLKLFFEVRVPWILVFFVSVSCACKFYDMHGYVPAQSLFMCLAHFLYCNACMKGEENIPLTWDIFYEKWGFMLIFWNMAGVPFPYSISSVYIFTKGADYFTSHNSYLVALLFVVLLVAYRVFDEANSQRCSFRALFDDPNWVPRKAFPFFPNGVLKNPKFIKTEHGSPLLIDGWWKYARKINYTADLVMSLSWGLITGFSSFFPYFYFFFFVTVLIHRTERDFARCSKKYGKDWDRYCQTVPYILIPGVF